MEAEGMEVETKYQSTPYYPDTSDPYFGRKIFEKKEFFNTRYQKLKKVSQR